MSRRESSQGATGAALLVCAGAALFGTIGTARALGPADASSAGITLVRLAIAISLMWAAVAATGRSRMLGPVLRCGPVWRAGVVQAVFQVSFLSAVTRVGVATATLVAIGATPLLTGLYRAVRTRQLARTWVGATGCGLVGLVLLVGIGDGTDLVGLLLALTSSATYATFIVLGGTFGARGLDTTIVLPVVFTVAAAVQLPVLAVADWGWLGTGSGRWMVLYLALVPTVLAYALFNRGLTGVDSPTASTIGLVEPLVATVLAVVALGQPFGPVQAVGAVLVGSGVVLAARAPQSYARMDA